jgi:hypothetical protein
MNDLTEAEIANKAAIDALANSYSVYNAEVDKAIVASQGQTKVDVAKAELAKKSAEESED